MATRPPPRKIKAQAAATRVPQTRADCAADIRALGDTQRQYLRAKAEMDDAVARINDTARPLLELLQADMEGLRAGIQTWCEANRTVLCGEGDKLGKTANLITGEVAWRQRPPSIAIRNPDGVCSTLLGMGLSRYVRTRTEPNREAMLADPDPVRGIPGVAIVSGVEDFAIMPVELNAEVPA